MHTGGNGERTGGTYPRRAAEGPKRLRLPLRIYDPPSGTGKSQGSLLFSEPLSGRTLCVGSDNGQTKRKRTPRGEPVRGGRCEQMREIGHR